MLVDLKSDTFTHSNSQAKITLKKWYGTEKLEENKVKISKCMFKKAPMKEIQSAANLKSSEIREYMYSLKNII